MTSKAFRIAFPRKSRLGTIFSIAISLSLLTPLAPAVLSARAAGAALPAAPRALAAGLAVPAISATKTDAFPDLDNDGEAAPGETITYTVQITNGGTDAEDVEFNDTVDANTTFVPGSITTTPVAVNDSYTAVGNVRISVPSGPGDLTGNDSDPDGDTLTASAVSPTSANGGDVTVNADGSFTYNPPAGFEGADTFSYTVTDGDGPADTATVTVNVSGMIWFVDSSAAAGGDGRLTSPFNALTGPGSFDAVAADDQNDNIFLYDGPYTGGLALQSGQALIGEGAGASLATITGLTPPSYSDPLPATGGSDPVIGGASGISLATNNLIRGLTIQNTGGTGISGSAFGTLAVAETTVNSMTAAQALSLDNGKLLASFDAVSSTGSGSTGVSLTNIAVNSVFSGGATSVSGAAGVGILINNVGAGSSLSFGSTDILNRSNTGIELDNVDGSLAFGATTIPNPNSAGGYGINLRNSAAAVSFGSANISDTKLTQAQLDVDLNLIPDNDGNGDAIFLKDNTGSFTVNGGVLSNCDNDCLDARSSSNVALFGVAINNPGVTASGGSGTGGHGIQAINLSGANTLTSTNISDFDAAGRDGLRIINNVPTAMTFTVDAGTFTHATAAAGSGVGILIHGQNDANMALTVQGNSTFSNLVGAAIAHAAGTTPDSTATVNLTVQNSTFQNSAPLGQNTVHASVTEGGKAAVLVSGNTFDNVAQTAADTSGVIDINGDATDAGNSLSATVTNNVITNIGSASLCGALPCNSRRGIDVFMDDSTNVSGTVVIDGNQLSNMRRTGIVFDVGSVFDGSNIAAKITNNTVGTAAARVGTGNAISAGGEIGINVQNRNNNSKNLFLNLSDNTVRNGNGGAGSALNTPGVFLRSQNSAGLAATLTGNDIETSTSTTVAELRVDTSLNTPVLCLDANGNTLDSGNGRISLNRNAGALDVEQASAADLATANGIPAANVTVVGAVSFGIACAPPPLAMFRTNAGGDYLAALSGPTAKAAQGFGYLSGLRLNGAFELLPNLGDWRSNSKTRLGGLSYRYAAGNVALGSSLSDAVVRPAREASPASRAYAPAAAALAYAGETITLPIGTLPAGKSMTITFQVTINNSINTPQVSNQGTVTADGGVSVPTDDPDTGAFGDPTVTPVFLGTPPDISCPADISVGTDPGVSTASVSFSVSATGTPSPTIDCKVGATSITSPHTFPLGETTVVCTATNGNAPDDSCSFKVTVADDEAPQIDCPPDITVTLPLNSNATGMAVNFNVTATDNVDPTPTVNTSVASGSVFPVGTTTVTATATDDAGNQSECTFNVTVLYNFAGFFSPVANLPTFNSVKAGQTIPIKFSLSGNKGLNIFAAGYPASGPIVCASGDEPNDIDETQTAGGSGLQYDASTGVYTYAWKTEKTWKDTCRQLVIQLNDGTFHRANFQFK